MKFLGFRGLEFWSYFEGLTSWLFLILFCQRKVKVLVVWCLQFLGCLFSFNIWLHFIILSKSYTSDPTSNLVNQTFRCTFEPFVIGGSRIVDIEGVPRKSIVRFLPQKFLVIPFWILIDCSLRLCLVCGFTEWKEKG